MEDLNQLTTEMLTSIKALESEKQMYSQEILRLRKQVSGHMGVENSNYGGNRKIGVDTPKNQILVLGDGLAQNFRSILDRCLNSRFVITTVVKQNALLDEVVYNIVQLTKTFTKNDYVVVMGGMVNLLNGIRVKEETIKKLEEVRNYTNLVIFSVPLWENNLLLNKFINEHNKMIFQRICIRNDSVTFLHFNAIINSWYFVFKNNLHIKYIGKVLIAQALKNKICRNLDHTVTLRYRNDNRLYNTLKDSYNRDLEENFSDNSFL